MKTLGEILIEDGAANRAQIETALARQRAMPHGLKKRLGEILLEMGVVTTEQLQRAVDRQHLMRT